AHGGRWLIVADHFDQAGALNRRFFRELVRRVGPFMNLTLAVVVPVDAAQRALDEFRGFAAVDAVRLKKATGFTELTRMQSASSTAEELERATGNDLIEWETNYPQLISAWQEAGRPDKTYLWQSRALGICNHRGFYEDALAFVIPVSDGLDQYCPDEVTRWNLVGNMFQCLAAMGRAEEAKAIVERHAASKIVSHALQARVNYVLAMLHARYLPQKNFQRASDYLEEALRILADVDVAESQRHFYTVFASNGLALVRHRQGRPQDALRLCREGFERLEQHLGPLEHRLHRSVLLYNIAQVYTAIRSFDDAVRHYSGAIAMDPNYSEYYNERGGIYLRQRKLEEALADFKAAIDLSPPYPEVWLNLGQCYRLMGLADKAVAAYGRALELDPSLLLAYTGRAQCHQVMGEDARAIADYTSALALEPNQPLVLANRAALHFARGDVASSIADLDQAIRLAPGNADLYVNRSMAFEAAGRPLEALADLQNYLQMQPQAPDRAEIENKSRQLALAAS
ncbi:MAG TPA: tetratricopeptide repeat protein, partial [Candidatus Angelobacter sp.]|nr:tetratricopeptide repeat protein [Candidatus Angelobacter sp.]